MESLYRKYRPQTFDDVVGQGHVVETLEHAVLEGRTSHAYLFCGPRGTGKTTMARLLAKALMCEQGPGHLPDGTCDQCQLIAAGEHPDVYELDAASRTGVDNVREEIINRVNYAPARGRYKVYIIDEVHMLTTAAFNALLKTLEEPPSHVVFVLCTTDPQKIPATILSRVQRFDFHAIGNEEMRGRLAYVCEKEGFTYDDGALDLIVRHARGGMRDALSTLEQLSVFGDGEVSLAAAQDLLGEVPGSSLCAVSQALAVRDVATLFGEVAKLVDSGRDLLQFTRELAAHMRDVYVVAAVGTRPGVVQASGEALDRLGREAEAFGSADRVARILTILGDASSEMRTATNQRLVLEIALTRMARPEADLTLEALEERLGELERQVAALSMPGALPSLAPRQGTTRQEPAGRRHEQEPGQTTTSQPVPAPQAQGQREEAPRPKVQRSRRAQAPAARPSAVPTVDRQPVQEPSTAAQGAAASGNSPQGEARAAGRRRSATRHDGPSRPQSKSGGSPVTDGGQLQRMWKQVVDTLVSTAASRGSLLMNSTIVSDDGSTLQVSLPKGSGFALRMLERGDVRATVDPVVSQVFGPRKIVFGEAVPQDAGSIKAARRAQRSTNGQGRYAASHAEQPAAPPKEDVPRPASPVQASPVQARSAYEMPWDRPGTGGASRRSTPQEVEAPYEAVPYDDASATYYDESLADDGLGGGTPIAGATGVSPRPSSLSGPARDPRPEGGKVAKETPEPPSPSPTPAKEDLQQTDGHEAAGAAPQREVPDDIPPDLIAIVESAFDVFGDGVKISKA